MTDVPLTENEKSNRFTMGDKDLGPILKNNATSEEREAFQQKLQQIRAVPNVGSIDRSHDVPYGAGKLTSGGVAIDRHVPSSIIIDGVTFDPADPVSIHENVEYKHMQKMIADGSSDHEAYIKSHTDFATPAEKKWVQDLARANGKDPEKFWMEYEHKWDGWLSSIEHEKPENPPPDLYVKPYPHDKQVLLKKAASNE